MCVDRVSVGLAAGVRQGVSDELPAVRHQGRRCSKSPSKRVDQLKANGFAQAAVYDPPGVGGTNVVTVLAFGDRPELYGLPRNPTMPLAVRLWKGPLKTLGNVAHARWVACGRGALHPRSAGRTPRQRRGLD